MLRSFNFRLRTGPVLVIGLAALLGGCTSHGIDTPDATLYRSAAGEEAGVSPEPLVVFGNYADVTAKRMAEETTMNCLAVRSPEALDEVLRRGHVLALVAMSRSDHPGEAQAAILKFRELNVHGAAFYGAWDYSVARAAERALACNADGISMPGILVTEQYAYLLGVMAEVNAGSAPPSTVAQHEARLRQFTSDKSPFWKQQDLIVSACY